MRLETFKSFMYREVWEVLSYYPTGETKKTRFTGKYIHRDDIPNLPPNYIPVSMSTESIEPDVIDIELFM